MITIKNYQTTSVPFTLTEKTTIPLSAVTYVLELTNKQSNTETYLLLSGDTSTNIQRYNYFPIDITTQNLNSGTYNYKVYQTTGNTIIVSALTSNDVVESGLSTIIGSGTTQTPVYTLTSTEFIFE
jgi:hypothetical protein